MCSGAQIERRIVVNTKILIMNIRVMCGKKELNDEGSKDEKMSDIITKHRCVYCTL